MDCPGLTITVACSTMRSSSGSRHGRAKRQRGRGVCARLVRRVMREDNRLSKCGQLMEKPSKKASTQPARDFEVTSLLTCMVSRFSARWGDERSMAESIGKSSGKQSKKHHDGPARLHFRKDAEGWHERLDCTSRASPRRRQGRSLPGRGLARFCFSIPQKRSSRPALTPCAQKVEVAPVGTG